MTNEHTTTNDKSTSDKIGKEHDEELTRERTGINNPADLKQELDRLNRNLSEALDRQDATNEILHLISRSPSDTQPVFDAIVRSGSKLFSGAAVSVALPIGDVVDAVAKNFLATGYRAVTMMPLVRDGKAIGVLGIVRLEPGRLSDQQLAVLKTFAAQAVIAIEIHDW